MRQINLKQTPYFAFAISLLLHFLCFKVVLLSFSSHFESRDPLFIFWGSILENQEVKFLFRDKSQEPRSSERHLVFLSQDTLTTPKKENLLLPQKPGFHKILDTSVKSYIKSHFLDFSDMDDGKKRSAFAQEVLGIDINAPLYLPLKMD